MLFITTLVGSSCFSDHCGCFFILKEGNQTFCPHLCVLWWDLRCTKCKHSVGHGVCCRDCWELQGRPRVSVSVAQSPVVTSRQARSYKMPPPPKKKKTVLEHNNSSCLAMSSPASVRGPSVRNAEGTNQINEV